MTLEQARRLEWGDPLIATQKAVNQGLVKNGLFGIFVGRTRNSPTLIYVIKSGQITVGKYHPVYWSVAEQEPPQ